MAASRLLAAPMAWKSPVKWRLIRVNGVPREDGFDITVASEIMAVLCLASDITDLKNRLIHVHAAAPGDPAGVNAQLVALIDMVIQHGGQQVVGSADGVEVAGKVEVDVLHGNEQYGNYKAKVDYNILNETEKREGKLVLVTAFHKVKNRFYQKVKAGGRNALSRKDSFAKQCTAILTHQQ